MNRQAANAADRPRAPGRRHEGRPTAFIAALGLAWGAGLATQYMAARLDYASYLGGWLYRAPATSRPWLYLAMAIGAVAVATAALVRGWRWASVPLVLVTASLYAVLDGPIYPPTGVLQWYATHGQVPVDRAPFRIAWIIVVVSAILVTTAAHRLGRHGASRLQERRPMEPTKETAIGKGKLIADRRRSRWMMPSSWPGHARLRRGFAKRRMGETRKDEVRLASTPPAPSAAPATSTSQPTVPPADIDATSEPG